MGVQKYRLKKLVALKRKALFLYKQGLSLREVGKIVKRSHEWVNLAVKELSTGRGFDKN